MSAPTIGNVTTGVGGGSGTYSFSHNSNSDLLLVLISTGYTSAGGMPTGVTYNGVSMTLLTSITTNGARTGIYYLKSPATGANNVTVTISGDGAYGAGAVSVIGADLTTTFGTPATANGNGSAASVSVATTTTNDLVVACLATRGVTNPTDTVTLSGTTLYNTYTAFGSGDSHVSGNSAAGTGSAVAMTGTISSAFEWSMCAVAVAGAAGGGGSTPIRPGVNRPMLAQLVSGGLVG